MYSFGKSITLLLILTICISCLTPLIKPVNAQTVPKPSMPEFTVQLVDRSYNEPPAYQTDPYTGETKLIWAGGHVDNKTLDFTIKNQPFTRYKDANGNDVELYYKIQHKGYFEDWSDSPSFNIDIVRPSSSEDTFASFTISKFSGWDISPNGTVDIRVKAITGYYSVDNSYPWPGRSFLNTVSESDWSNTQTISISDGSVSVSTSPDPAQSQTPTPTPSVPEFSWLMILPLFAFVLFYVVLVRFRNRLNKNIN